MTKEQQQAAAQALNDILNSRQKGKSSKQQSGSSDDRLNKPNSKFPQDDDSSDDSKDTKSNKQDNKQNNSQGKKDKNSNSQDNSSKRLKDMDELQIGDTGNQKIQDKEEKEREKQIAKEGGTQESNEERETRLKKIKDALANKDNKDSIEKENQKQIYKERDAKNLKANSYKQNHLEKASKKYIIDNIIGFFKNEMSRQRQKTWARPSRTGTNVARQGIKHSDRDNAIPKVAIFTDQSGSWSESDLEISKAIVDALAEYERKGKIKIDEFFFANNVYSNAKKARAEGGTGAGNQIIQEIKLQRADNVIVITDTDMSTLPFVSLTVKGGVWLIYKDGDCTNLTKALKGEKLTKHYLIED